MPKLKYVLSGLMLAWSGASVAAAIPTASLTTQVSGLLGGSTGTSLTSLTKQLKPVSGALVQGNGQLLNALGPSIKSGDKALGQTISSLNVSAVTPLSKQLVAHYGTASPLVNLLKGTAQAAPPLPSIPNISAPAAIAQPVNSLFLYSDLMSKLLNPKVEFGLIVPQGGTFGGDQLVGYTGYYMGGVAQNELSLLLYGNPAKSSTIYGNTMNAALQRYQKDGVALFSPYTISQLPASFHGIARNVGSNQATAEFANLVISSSSTTVSRALYGLHMKGIGSPNGENSRGPSPMFGIPGMPDVKTLRRQYSREFGTRLAPYY